MEIKLKATLIVLAVVVVAMMEKSSALSLCNMDQNDLNTCRPAVTKPTPSAPSQDCCQSLSKADLGCLCGYKGSPWLSSLGIDPDLAMALPAKCGLKDVPNC